LKLFAMLFATAIFAGSAVQDYYDGAYGFMAFDITMAVGFAVATIVTGAMKANEIQERD
jgi:hypothetical protein